MGTSTVSGPFRSENGFQELVNGQWVPVAGGGGGGVTSIIAGSGISVSSPTGAVTIAATGSDLANIQLWGLDTISLPNPKETTIAPGTTYSYTFGLPSYGGTQFFAIEGPIDPDFAFLGSTVTCDQSLFPAAQFDPIIVIGDSSFGIINIGDSITGQITIVYQGFLDGIHLYIVSGNITGLSLG